MGISGEEQWRSSNRPTRVTPDMGMWFIVSKFNVNKVHLVGHLRIPKGDRYSLTGSPCVKSFMPSKLDSTGRSTSGELDYRVWGHDMEMILIEVDTVHRPVWTS